MDGEMTNLESLRSLQKRIREAKGADRELDAEIAITLELIPGPPWKIYADANGTRVACHTLSGTEIALGDFNGYITIPKFTLDPDGLGPCVALQRALLPDAYFCVRRTALRPGMIPGSAPSAYCGECGDWGQPSKDCHDSIVLAALLAIVSALIAQEEAKEKADVD